MTTELADYLTNCYTTRSLWPVEAGRGLDSVEVLLHFGVVAFKAIQFERSITRQRVNVNLEFGCRRGKLLVFCD
jgi:hypothetical protein